MDSEVLLEIQPSHEVKFEFELKKPSTSFIRLVNKSDEYVAFRITATTPMTYLVRPNIGILKPNTSRNVKITMLAKFVPPRDLTSCDDEFWIERTVVQPWTWIEDVKRINFSEEEEEIAKRDKLRVVIIDVAKTPQV